MANKFDKAIENRSSEILDSGKTQTTENIRTTIEDNSINQNGFNLNDIIGKTEKNSKNKTYYLEISVIDEIKKVAKSKKVSESKIVNDILKHVLNIK